MKIKYDFGGYVTRADVKCTDGRTIASDAFAHNDGQTVPLVWRHMHDAPTNVLDNVKLEQKDDGVYGYGKFNSSPEGNSAKILIEHGDVKSLSIYANRLVEKHKRVAHGEIREVSLVLTGANPGAVIDYVAIQHADGQITEADDEVIIHMDLEIEIKDPDKKEDEDLTKHVDIRTLAAEIIKHGEGSEETLGDVFTTLSNKQKDVVYAIVSHLLSEGDIKHADETDEGDETMKKNVFDGSGNNDPGPILTHDDFEAIVVQARLGGGSLKTAFLADEKGQAVLTHEGTYGIDNISYMFPDARLTRREPDFISREMDWVTSVIQGTRHSPFSRVKALHADITADEARAKGYVRAAEKVEEVFPMLTRTTEPTTIYKLQKLDRDDIVDITDFGVVQWLKKEMRIMMNEEVGRAVLVGDGRGAVPDKVDETKIRPIWGDSSVYVTHRRPLSSATVSDLIDEVITARTDYRGAGQPLLFVAPSLLTSWLLMKDADEHRLYKGIEELARDMRVKKIVEVPIMEGLVRTDTLDYNLRAIMVNLADYTIGADKGGKLNFFDDFDLDFNQYKYLYETRISGAMVTPFGAVVIEQAVV